MSGKLLSDRVLVKSICCLKKQQGPARLRGSGGLVEKGGVGALRHAAPTRKHLLSNRGVFLTFSLQLRNEVTQGKKDAAFPCLLVRWVAREEAEDVCVFLGTHGDHLHPPALCYFTLLDP